MESTKAKIPNELIDLANARSRETGENAAEELMNLLLKSGLGIEESASEKKP